MAYGASIRLQDLSLILSRQHFSADSTTLLSGACKVWTRRTTKQNFHRRCNGLSQFSRPVTQWPEKEIKTNGNIKEPLQASDLSEEIKRGIHVVKERVQSVDDGNLSLSAYDTAWVAIVKDIDGSDAPMFPSSLDWIINNQLPDGSWGDPYYFCAYDRLSCTLACVVALKTWNINPEGCEKGLSFLRQNVHRIHEEDPEHQLSGFEVTFPTLVEMAEKLGLCVVPNSSVLQDLLAKRELKLKRIPKEILYYVPTTLLHSLEGIPDLDWEKLLKLQHPNGSFLCSPSSTAYALMKTKDENCFRYLTEIVQRFNGGVPHSYPMDLFERLWVVDRLERLGFSRYFKSEIKELLDYVYRCWTQNGISWSRDTIEFDIDDTCMGLRMLRLHGYDVNGSALQHFERDGEFFCFVGQNSQGITEMLSLYRASQLLFPGEKILDKAKAFSSSFLRKKQDLGQIEDRWLITKDLVGEVNYYLDVPWYANLPRIETRNYIDQYGGDDDVWIAKTLYRMYNVSTNDYLELAKVDYNHCQQLHRTEWSCIQMWYEDYNLKELGLSKDDLLKLYFVAMSSIFEPEQATERLAWAKTAALIETVSIYYKESSVCQFKDFIQAFDNRGFGSIVSRNELVDVIHNTLSEIALNVRDVHGKDVYYNLKHLWNTWLLKLKTQGDASHVPEDEAELLVKTINLCARNSCTVGLIPQPEYVHLTNLTNEICNHLREIQNIKVRRKANGTKEIVNNLPIESLDRQMQELMQYVVKTEGGTDQQIRQTFLTVAKGYYYTSYCEPATIDIHIAKVLFKQLV